MTGRMVPPASGRLSTLRRLETDLQTGMSAALTLNGVGSFMWDLSTDLIYLDTGALAVFDLAGPGEFDGRLSTLHQRMMPDDLPVLWKQAAEALVDAGDYRAYFRIQRSDGAVCWAYMQIFILRDSAVAARRAVGIVRDAGAELNDARIPAPQESQRQFRSDAVRIMTNVLAQVLTVEDVLAALAGEEVLGSLGAAGMSLAVLEQNRLRRLATASVPPQLLRDLEFTRLDDPLPLSEVVRTQLPLFLTREDLRLRYPLLWPFVRETDMTAAAVLPLTGRTALCGAMAIHYEGRGGFSPEERTLLMALAGTVAQSFQRALLYDEEHSMVAALQQAVLPTRLPRIRGLQVATRYKHARTEHQIGGVWYDVVPLPTGRVGLMVGSVQGNDIPAAAVVSQLRAAARAYAFEGHPPASVLGKLSGFLHNLETGRLAACTYVDLDPRTGHANVVETGHPNPLIRRTDRRIIRLAVEDGPPLGLSEHGERDYPTTHLRIGPEDTLLLRTNELPGFPGTGFEPGGQVEAPVHDSSVDLEQLAERIIATVEGRELREDTVAILLAARSHTADSPEATADAQ
jgi:GAF domain-containing protein